MDDLLVHGKDVEEHMRLIQVLKEACKIILKMNKSKCKIAVPVVDYMGHRLTEGLKPTDK